MNITINAIETCIDMQVCMTAEEIRSVAIDDELLGMLKEYVLYGWPLMKLEVQKDLQLYWSFADETAINDGIDMKWNRTIIPASLNKKKTLSWLYMNHMGIETTRLLACKSIYQINMNTDIEDRV